jgi:hypothetical protein
LGDKNALNENEVDKMTKYNRREQLQAVHRARRADTKQKIEAAIQQLIQSSQSINFNSVSKEAGISKATLYNTPQLRKQVETLRQQ